MKCEVVREGQACGNNATLIVRTPWATQLACEGCSWSFKRYETQRIDEFVCDWPVGGKECGEPATHYLEVDGGQRPLCVLHATSAASKFGLTVGSINSSDFNPKLVPYKPPARPPPRVEQKADGAVILRCACGALGKYRGGAEPMPLCDEHAPQTTTPKTELPLDEVQHWERKVITFELPASVTVRSQLKDLAITAIQILKEKLQKWR